MGKTAQVRKDKSICTGRLIRTIASHHAIKNRRTTIAKGLPKSMRKVKNPIPKEVKITMNGLHPCKDYLRGLADNGMGYKAMTTRLRADRGLVVSQDNMKDFRKKLFATVSIGETELSKHADYLRTLVEAKMGKRAMVTQLFKDKHIVASVDVMGDVRKKLVEQSAKATGEAWQ